MSLSPPLRRHALSPSPLTVRTIGITDASNGPSSVPSARTVLPSLRAPAATTPSQRLAMEDYTKSTIPERWRLMVGTIGTAYTSNCPPSVPSARTVPPSLGAPTATPSQRLTTEDYIKLPSPERWRLLVGTIGTANASDRPSSVPFARNVLPSLGVPAARAREAR